MNQAATKALDIFNHRKPGECPVVENSDITSISLQQVGQMCQYYTSMHAYALQEMALADQRLVLAEYSHDVLKKKLQVEKDRDQQKYRLDAEIAQDPALHKKWASVLEARTYKRMLEALTRGLEQKAAMASREISRRGAEK